MDPTNYQPQADLPRPHGMEAPEASQINTQHNAQRSAEVESVAAELPLSPSSAPLGQGTSAPSSMPYPIAPTGQPAAGQASLPSLPTAALPAEDRDLIEKEWVDRAKAVVNHTRHDPREQSQQVNAVKADYLKKRYNKDVSLGDVSTDTQG